MKLSTKGRYGTRFMVRLAMAGPEAVCTLRQIAEAEDISEKYLWQIARSLKDAGFIRAAPGAHGGYRLTRAPATLTLHDILRALEGEMAPVDCIGQPGCCGRSSDRAVRSVWAEVAEKVAAVLSGFTLEAMVERQRRLGGSSTPDFSI